LAIPHDETIIRQLRKDPQFAAEYIEARCKMKTSLAFC